MADEVKTSKIAAAGNSIGKFFKDIISELKKVVWPTRIQVIKNTGTVLLACFLVGIIIWLADAGFGKLRTLIFGI